MPMLPYNTPSPTLSRPLKRIVLRCDLLNIVVSEYRDLLHDVVADLGYLGEEEEGEETGDATETTEENSTGINR
jgi:hypothetical protein